MSKKISKARHSKPFKFSDKSIKSSGACRTVFILEAYCNRGLIRLGLGDYQSALADFNEALLLDPNHADAYNKRGNALANLGDLRQALGDFDSAVRLAPNSTEAYYNRGVARTEVGNLQGAIADYTRAIRLNPVVLQKLTLVW